MPSLERFNLMPLSPRHVPLPPLLILLLLLVIILLSCSRLPVASHATSAHSTDTHARAYCYDNCSYPTGGICVDNVCRCNPGYQGENCGTRYGVYPELSIGVLNLTSSKEARQFFASREAVLVGVSMSLCPKCAAVEAEYARANLTLLPLVRVDAAKHSALVKEIEDSPATTVPYLVLVWSFGKRHGLYRGYQTAAALKRFEEMKGTRYSDLPESVKTFVDDRPDRFPPGTCAFVYHYVRRGNARTPTEDEYEEWVEITEDFRSRHEILFFEREVGDTKTQDKKREAWMPPHAVAPLDAKGKKNNRYPVVGFGCRPHLHPVVVSHPEERPIGEKREEAQDVKWTFVSLAEKDDWGNWIALAAVPTGVPLTPETYAAAEAANLPMLLLFLKDPATPALARAFHSVALEFRGRLAFFRSDAETFMKKIEDLGGGAKVRFPALFLNTKDQGLVRFTSSSPTAAAADLIDERKMPDIVRQFCGEYVSGKRMASSSPVVSSKRGPAAESAAKSDEMNDEEKDVPGVSEGFSKTDDAHIAPILSLEEYRSVALDETKDVLLLVHRSKGCSACRAFAPYFKRVAARLEALREKAGHRIRVARLDLSHVRGDTPDTFLPNEAGIPALVMLPANAKSPPYRYYTGVTKVLPMMEWARLNAAQTFEWGEELPQFDEHQKVLFREQIKEREERRAKGEEL